MVSKAIEAYDILKAEGINISVVNVHTIKPLDNETVLKYAAKTGCVVTAEEHFNAGGLGSAICELLSEQLPTKVLRVGISDIFCQSGKAAELLEYYGLTGEGIAGKVRQILGVSK